MISFIKKTVSIKQCFTLAVTTGLNINYSIFSMEPNSGYANEVSNSTPDGEIDVLPVTLIIQFYDEV